MPSAGGIAVSVVINFPSVRIYNNVTVVFYFIFCYCAFDDLVFLRSLFGTFYQIENVEKPDDNYLADC